MVEERYNVQFLDKLTAKLYNDFHKENKELFVENRLEYWRLASAYVRRELEKVKSGS